MLRRVLLAAPLALGGVAAQAATDPLSDGSFARHVAALLTARHPDWSVALADDPLFLNVQSARLFLRNIYLHLPDVAADQRDEAIVAFAEQGLRDLEAGSSSYAAVRGKIRAQLVPADYRSADPDIVGREFLAGLMIAEVVDEPDRYLPLKREQLAAWQVARETAEADGIANLEAASDQIAITPRPNDDGGAFVSIATSDGYDAARLLLPRFMSRVRATLGVGAVFAGIPNRDFLVAWTPNFGARRGFASRIARDVRERPHPLTDQLFFVTDAGPLVANAGALADHGR